MAIERVKQVPIIDIARELGISVDPSGKALCFNGHDTAPSLSFHQDGNYFKCFGCGAKGSTIDLVMQARGMTTREAIGWIENLFNLCDNGAALPRQAQNAPQGKAPQAAKTTREGSRYSTIYQDLLDRCDSEGAVLYLQGRGIGRQITERAGIRVAPRGIEKALIEKYGMEALQEAGIMAISSKSGQLYYTLFNTRLIIPYRDREGSRITNLQGRNIDSDQGAKYQLLKGIETTPYNLEALDQGKTLYLCEGAMDALSCYQLGLQAPLAFPGVQSFKEDYFNVLEPYDLIIAGDMDRAGESFYRHIKKGYLARGKKILHLDYETLKAAYGVTEQVKDLNDIAKLADYQHHERLKREDHCMSEYGITTDLDKSQELRDYLEQIAKQEAAPGLFREVRGKMQELETAWSEVKILNTMQDDLGRILDYTVKPHSLGAGFSPMNDKDYSLIRDGLITIGGEANAGKSSLFTALALDLIDKDPGKAFLFYTLDDSIFISGKRILSQIKEKNLFQAYPSLDSFKDSKVLGRIILKEALTITAHSNQILSDARGVKKLTGCKQIVVGVDYLQILPNGTDMQQREFFNMVVKSIKEAQKALEAEGGCVLFLLSQFNRDKTSGGYRYRETSEIENQSDVCLDIEGGEDKEDPSRFIKVSKNKLGRKGRAWETRIGSDFNFTPLIIHNTAQGPRQQGRKTNNNHTVENRNKRDRSDITTKDLL